MLSRVERALSLALLVGVISAPAFAQAVSGNIGGTVTDASGATLCRFAPRG